MIEKLMVALTQDIVRLLTISCSLLSFVSSVLENGIADLLINGSISVKSGVTLSRLTEASVVFSDGSELATDAIIFALVTSTSVLFYLKP